MNEASPPRLPVADVSNVSSSKGKIESEPIVLISRTGASDGIDVNALSLVAVDEIAVETTVFSSV